MTPQQVVGMAVRLFLVWLALAGIQAFGMLRMLEAQSEAKTSMLATFLVPLMFYVAAVLLWFFPMVVAHKLVPRTQHNDVLRMSARTATAAASAILGLWVVIQALPSVAALVGLGVYSTKTGLVATFFSVERIHQLAVAGLQALVGLFLMLRPWKLASWVFPVLAEPVVLDAMRAETDHE